MTKFVILGSCRFAPYEFLAVPNPIPGAWNTEEGYKKASEIFYPAIAQADAVLVYAPDGIGEHTARDILEAVNQKKEIFLVVPFKAMVQVRGNAEDLAKIELFKIKEGRKLDKTGNKPFDPGG